MRNFILVLFIILAATSCYDPYEPVWSDTPCGRINIKWVEDPTQAMQFGFVSDTVLFNKLRFSNDSLTLSKLRSRGYLNNLIYYLNNGVKTNIGYVSVSLLDTNTLNKGYFITTGEVMPFSWGFKHQKEYFIDWPNGDKDTLFADFEEDHSRNNEYCSQYPLRKLTLNGKTYKTNTKDFRFGVYLFE